MHWQHVHISSCDNADILQFRFLTTHRKHLRYKFSAELTFIFNAEWPLPSCLAVSVRLLLESTGSGLTLLYTFCEINFTKMLKRREIRLFLMLKSSMLDFISWAL